MSSSIDISTTTLSPSSTWVKRFYAWIEERFPLVQGVLIAVMYAASLLAGRAIGAESLTLGLADIPGFFALWAFFLMLRVFDEHKDYEKDLENHPERVLQSGLITLDHLKGVGAIAVLVQLGASILADLESGGAIGAATISWGVVMAWSALMAREFFVGAWLEKRLVLYAVSHMVVMPLAVFWIMQMGLATTWQNFLAAVPILLVGFFAAASLEVVRKTRAPQEERETVDSYTRTLGMSGAVVTGSALAMASAAAQSWFLAGHLSAPWWLHLGVWCFPILLVSSLVAFRRDPSVSARKRNEGAVALAILGGYLMVLAGILLTHPLTLMNGVFS